jgi:outer membrane protein
MKRVFYFLALSLLCLSSLPAEELALAELIDIALKNNPETQKVWASVKRNQALVGIAKSPYYPDLNAQGTINHGREKKFPNGPNTVFTEYGGELSLNYLLFDFGETRASVRAAKDGLASAKWWADFAIQRVISQVAASYYEYLNAAEILDSRESSLEEAETILDSAHELCDAGLRSESDFLAAKAAVAEIRMNLAQQNAAEAIAYGKLMLALGMPMETEIEVQTDPEGMHDPLFDEEVPQLIAAAEAQRADLMAKQATLDEMNERATRAKRAMLPKLRALGQGGWLEYGKHKGNGYNYVVGAALDIPLFKGFFHIYEKRQALADAELTAAELKELQNAVGLEVLSYSETVKAAKESIRFSSEYFDDAYRSYEGSMERYKAGLINIFDLLQSQRYLSDARNRKAQARTEWLVALSQLAFSTGSLKQ